AAAAPGALVSAKPADIAPAVAVTVYAPATVPAVAVTAARPSDPVPTGEPVTPAEAPDAGAAKLTATPGTALPYASVIRTTSGAANAAATVAVCPEPDTADSAAAAPGALVSAKPADSAPAVAVTVYAPATVPAVAVTAARP